MGNDDLLDYYARRAPEYESIYSRPERQADLRSLESLVARELEGLHVLELACGTGYWTQVLAAVAASVLATDGSPEVLAQARRKELPADRVTFRQLDAYCLPDSLPRLDAVFAGFWWSHVPRQQLSAFLSGLTAALGPGVKAVFLDNRFVPGSSTPLCRTDGQGNTYQRRTLSDGSAFEVLKNFPDAAEIQAAVAPFGGDVEVTELEYFWGLSYTTGT